MNLLRAVTLGVADLDRAVTRYADCFDYRCIEQDRVPVELAASWDAPAMAGRRAAIMRPSSGTPVDIRLVEAERVPSHRALRSYGWSAVELCVRNVHATHAHLASGPFTVIGAPSAIASLPTIHPMQVLGPDDEVVYLTQILVAGPSTGLPVVRSAIDRPFIVVLACADVDATAEWCVRQFGARLGQDLSIPYRMLNQSFDLPVGTLHRLVVVDHDGDIFLELDQYPAAAVARETTTGCLPPGIGLATLVHPDLATIRGPWLSPPTPRDGAVYDGRRAGVLRSPGGALFEIVEAAAREATGA